MITGLLLIRLGLPWVIEEFRKREQLSKASQGCPSWLKQWEERSALRLRLLTAIWILSWRRSRLCKGKFMVLETRMDRESSRGIGMRLLAPRLNNRNLIFFGSPVTALASAKVAAGKSPLGRALQWDALAYLPHCTDTDYKLLHTHTHIKICIHLPTPVALNRQPDKRRNSGCGTGWLLAGAGLLPLLQSRVFMVYVLLCWGVFPVLTLYSPRSIVCFFFFSPHLPHVMLYFFFPSTYISLLIIPCMTVYVTNNKEPWKGQIFLVYILGIRYHRLVILHLI